MQEREPFDRSKQIEVCPVCGCELHNIYLDWEDCPVFINEENHEVYPYYITDSGNFLLCDTEHPIVAHLEMDHAH